MSRQLTLDELAQLRAHTRYLRWEIAACVAHPALVLTLATGLGELERLLRIGARA